MAYAQKLNPTIMTTLILTMSLFLVGKSTPNTSIHTILCSVNKYSQNDTYANNVAYVLADLMNVTPNAGYNYTTHSPSSSAVCYGHATCNMTLSYNDCADCLMAARAAVLDKCPSSVGSTVEMVDCTMRYENYSFS